MDVDSCWSAYWEDGSEEMRQRLLLQYSPLVKFVAPRVSGGDLEATKRALESLTAAIEEYDPEHGRFEPYAVDRMTESFADPVDWDTGWSEVG